VIEVIELIGLIEVIKLLSINSINLQGLLMYAHIDKSLWKKLDPKADKCQLMGYQPGTKAFQLWRIWDQKIII